MIDKRVYVLEYNIHVNGFSGDEPKMESRIHYYSREERDDFINAYLDKHDKWYVSDIKTYFAKLGEVDMKAILDAI